MKFGINIVDSEISVFPCFVNPPEIIKLEKGNLVQLTSDGNENFIKIYKVQNNQLLWSESAYKCNSDDFFEIPEKFFNMLIPVRDNDVRVNIVKNKGFYSFASRLNIGKTVTVPGCVLRRGPDCKCEIKYIGDAKEIGPGIFFGFKILDPNDSIQQTSTLARKYFDCETTTGFLRPIDCLLNKKKSSNDKTNEPNTSRKNRHRNNKSQKPDQAVEALESNDPTIIQNPEKSRRRRNRNRSAKREKSIDQLQAGESSRNKNLSNAQRNSKQSTQKSSNQNQRVTNVSNTIVKAENLNRLPPFASETKNYNLTPPIVPKLVPRVERPTSISSIPRDRSIYDMEKLSITNKTPRYNTIQAVPRPQNTIPIQQTPLYENYNTYMPSPIPQKYQPTYNQNTQSTYNPPSHSNQTSYPHPPEYPRQNYSAEPHFNSQYEINRPKTPPPPYNGASSSNITHQLASNDPFEIIQRYQDTRAREIPKKKDNCVVM